jgi:hypothetical protein
VGLVPRDMGTTYRTRLRVYERRERMILWVGAGFLGLIGLLTTDLSDGAPEGTQRACAQDDARASVLRKPAPAIAWGSRRDRVVASDSPESSGVGMCGSAWTRSHPRGSRSAAFHRARAAAHGGGDLEMLGASQRGEACNYSRIFRSADQAVSGREAVRFAPTAPMAVPACLRRV